MANKITWTNKVTLDPKADVPIINKLRDQDINEVKAIVNEHADEINSIEDRVTSSEAAIVALDTSKADQADVDTLTSEVNSKASTATLNAAVGILETSIASKAAQTEVDALTTTVAGKASQTDLDSLSTTVGTKANQADLTALETEVDSKADTTTVNSALATLQTEVDGKASQAEVNSLSAEVADKADTSTVDGQLAVINANVSVKANQTEVDSIQADLALKANSADVNAGLDLKIDATEKGAASGVAELDGGGKVPTSQLPDSVVGALEYQGVWDAATNTPTIGAASSSNKGWYYKVNIAGSTDIDGISEWNVGDWIVSNGTTWDKVDNTDSVSSVAGRTGAVVLTKSDVGLANVDNTSDLNKALSTAAIAEFALYIKKNLGIELNTDKRVIEATIDWNNYIDTGFYQGISLSNTPSRNSSSPRIYMQVVKYTSTYGMQIGVDSFGKMMAYRVQALGIWEQWNYILDNRDLDILNASIATKESAFTKNTGFNLNKGKASGTVSEGDHKHILRAELDEGDDAVNIDLSGYVNSKAVVTNLSLVLSCPVGSTLNTIVDGSGSIVEGFELTLFLSGGSLTSFEEGNGIYVASGITLAATGTGPLPNITFKYINSSWQQTSINTF